jgi:hypothetical protein
VAEFPGEVIPEGRGRALRTLKARKNRLEAQVRHLADEAAGLKDIDSVLALVSAHLDLSCELLHAAAENAGSPEEEKTRAEAQNEARTAIRRFEELCAVDLSPDQKDAVRRAQGYAEVRRGFETLLLAGGAILLEEQVEDSRRDWKVARALSGAVRKYLAPDDRYQPLFRSEKLPGWLRSLVGLLFFVLAPEKQAEPPLGIEEEEEQTCCSARMTLPLSQAVHYLEKELVPALREELAGRPGDTRLQAQLAAAAEKLAQYRDLRQSPRARPLLPEKGFFTRGLTGWTAEGEMLITLAFPVRFRSGTNVSRMQDLVLGEFVRRLAGKGVCPALDARYRYLKSMESGRRGSSRLPGFRLHTPRALAELKAVYPYLGSLRDRRNFGHCLELVRRTGRRAPRQLLGLLQKQASLSAGAALEPRPPRESAP